MNKTKSMFLNAVCLYTAPEVIKFSAMFSDLTEVLETAMSGFVEAIIDEKVDMNLNSYFNDELNGLVVDVIEQIHEDFDSIFATYGSMLETLESEGSLSPAIKCVEFYKSNAPKLASLDGSCDAKEILAYLSFLNKKDSYSKELLAYLESFSTIFDKINEDNQKKKEQEQKDIDDWFLVVDNNNVVEVVTLIDKKIDVDMKDEKGRTALARAVEKDNYEVLNILISYGAKPTANFSGDSPIVIAIENNKPKFVEALLCSEHESIKDFDWQSYIQGYSTDYINDDYIDVIRHIISFNSEEVECTSIAEKAIKNNAVGILELLFDVGLDVNDPEASTPLAFVAISENNPEILRLLLENNSDIAVKNYQDETMLSYAIEKSLSEITDVLIEFDAKIDKGNHYNNIVLILKLAKDKKIPLQQVTQLKVIDYSKFDFYNRNFLHCFAGYFSEGDEIPDGVEQFILSIINDENIDINKLTDHEVSPETALTLSENEVIFDCILSCKPDLEIVFNEEKTIFDKVVNKFDGRAIVKLVNAGANPDWTINKTPLIHYCIKNNKSFLGELLNNNANPNVLDEDGFTVLQKEITNKESIEPNLLLLAEKGANFNLETNTGLPIFHALCANYDLKIIEKIIELSNTDINILDKNNNNAILQACLAENISCIEMLSDKGLDVNQINSVGGSAILHAIYTDNTELLEVLVDKCHADTKIEVGGKSLLFISNMMAMYDTYNLLMEYDKK